MGVGSMTAFGAALRKLLEPVTPKASVASASVKCSNASDVSDEDGGLGKAQHIDIAKASGTGRSETPVGHSVGLGRGGNVQRSDHC